jgi:hypothetical protein
MSDILEKQNLLQEQTKTVLNNLNLINELSKYGEVKIVGSVALGLMTWPDIDIDLKSSEEINKKDYLEIVKYIFEQDNIKQLILIDNRSSFEKNRPKSMYIGVIYDLNGVDWKIDIRYLNPSSAWAEEDVERIKTKLTSEKINSILEIKTAFCSHYKYRKEFSAFDIYNAVLDNNIFTVEDFNNFLKEKGINLV